ncbi:HotDog domain-containing protein [Phlyctochytrium arcticum]|nr:HotDog domain-containing protein [Phlyctochytrium arcticum]
MAVATGTDSTAPNGILLKLLRPFLTGRLQYLVILLVILQIRSFPLVHHFRIFTAVLKANRLHTSKPAATIWTVLRQSYRVWLDDMDWNGHMNNSSYNKHLDFARTNWTIRLFGLRFNKQYRLMNAGVQIWFKRELKPFQQYVIDTDLLGYEEKWIYLRHKFIALKDGEEHIYAVATSKLVFKEKSGKTLPFAKALALSGINPIAIGSDEERRASGVGMMTGLIESEKALMSSHL